MRVTWGDQFSHRDIMLTHLFLYLSVEAAYTGRSEVSERMDCYRPARRTPPGGGAAGAAGRALTARTMPLGR